LRGKAKFQRVIQALNSSRVKLAVTKTIFAQKTFKCFLNAFV